MYIEILQNIHLFSQASEETLRHFAKAAHQHFYKKSVIVLDQRECSHTFLYVIKGWVKIFKESADGEEIIVDVLTDGHH